MTSTGQSIEAMSDSVVISHAAHFSGADLAYGGCRFVLGWSGYSLVNPTTNPIGLRAPRNVELSAPNATISQEVRDAVVS